MSNYAIIDASGNVVNIVEVEADALLPTQAEVDGVMVNVPAAWAPPEGHTAVQSDTAQIGWTYANEQFVAPPAPPVPAPVVPPAPTLAQLQAQLTALAAQIAAATQTS